MSFDNIGPKFEYVRYGASWQLQQHNLDLVQDLFKRQGHWGGIHAVYNLYNITNLVEFKNFAHQRGLSIKWQPLGTPPALDTKNYGREIAAMAATEIQRMFETCDIDDEERVLFGTALAHYQSVVDKKPEKLAELKRFVDDIEQYHPDQQGKFAELWPEISSLL
jgi:hypothetical protein